MDPIAVDVSVKSPISLGLGSRPITTLNGSSRPEAKPEPTKPPFTAPTPVAAGPTTMPGKIAASLGFQPSRKNGLALAAAACSLIAGIAAVKYLAPVRPTEGTQPLVAEVAKKEEVAKATETPKGENRPAPVVEVQQSSFLPGGSVIPLAYPTAPPVPLAPSSTVPPPASSSVATVVPPTTPTYTVPPAATSAVIPSTLPTVILPATLPTIPTLPSTADGFVTAGSSKAGTSIAPPGDLLPPTIAPPSIFPASAIESPVVSPAPPAVPIVPPSPSSVPPLPMIPTMVPSTPTPVIPSTVPTTPTALPISPPASVVPPSTFPSTAPEMPKPLTIEYSKPAGSPEVKPTVAAPDRTAVTSFDVDLHEPKNGDSYSTISKEFYNDVKYAGALQEYNGRRALQTSVWVQVPPIHVLKKRYPQLIGSVVPASGKAGDVWGPSGDAATPAFRATGQRTFTVPAGGMTMGSIARDTLGSPNRWQDIYAVNPSLSPGDVLPAGTVVKIPADVKNNQ